MKNKNTNRLNIWLIIATVAIIGLLLIELHSIVPKQPVAEIYDRASGLYLVPENYAPDTLHDITFGNEQFEACAVGYTDNGSTIMSTAPQILEFCDGNLPGQ